VDDNRYLQSLIREGEHQQQDFKYRVSDARKLAKSVSAFANTDGGRLLIGVRDDGHMSGVRDEEEIYMMHQAAYRYCSPQASIKFDTYHVTPSGSTGGARGQRTVVIATVPPSDRRPICAIDDEGRQRAYIRIADENIVASPVHLAIWRDQQNAHGTMMTYTDTVRRLIAALGAADGNDATATPRLTLNQIVRRSAIPRHKVITLLARLVRFRIAQWEYVDQQFLFRLL
jgi:predicted HTH transcriptional regulator